MLGRVHKVQGGWLSGFGCVDPAVAMTATIQQCRRLGQPLWILYIDLATMFPGINREACTMAELMHGLPKSVVELTTLIYGSREDPGGCVQCQYDSEAGLGDAFSNWMGALMGCVLSPDRAKMLIDSVIRAVAAVAKGVRLFGYSAEGMTQTLGAVAQLAFADDWAGAFTSLADLKRAWAIWSLWEPSVRIGDRHQKSGQDGADRR